MGPTKSTLNNNVISTLMPQISDPKIIVQTFDSPSPPILPNVLPQPKVKLNLRLPKRHTPVYEVRTRTVIRKESPSIAAGLQDIEQSVEQQFEKVMADKDPTHSRFYFKGMASHFGKTSDKQKFEILASPADRTLFNAYAGRKVEELLERMQKLASQYRVFEEEVSTKLNFLNFLRQHTENPMVDIIV